ncbi:hypothetical protein BLA14095_01445 [Burkholderia lata]|uniref:hypothetical protein n=1 Tax=Burkholderia lata (strain ATCC 17760 / DSM 23089 / LMG 22485 / NCIMB 9086 / R18194 / 383) TaxID=482957 RepID=UPI001452C8CE|nr:hypothetical protein [Burkholderia lata]VWB35952.1 hypothetical protein BLA14095_01445 [Burkholderia lata]
MTNHRTNKKPSTPQPNLTLRSGGAVCKVVLSQRPLRIYFQAYPGITGTEAERALAGIPYKLRIPCQPDIEGQTEPNGQILLPGLQPGLTGELQILGTMIHLRPRDFSADEATDRATVMGIQGAKRRLMIMGYYDKPYRSNGQNQVPDDKLDHVEIEDAILQFQVDSEMVSAPDSHGWSGCQIGRGIQSRWSRKCVWPYREPAPGGLPHPQGTLEVTAG